MASILKMPNTKKWRAHIFNKGKRKSKVFSTKRDAEIWVAQNSEDLKKIRSDFTLEEMLTRYKNEVTPKKKSANNEAKRINFFIKNNSALAKKKACEITRQDIAYWRDERLLQVTPGSLNRDWTTLSHAFKIAINEWEWLDANPMKLVKRPAEPPPRDRIITQHEIDTISHVASYDDESDLSTVAQRSICALHFSIETAMRAHEICNLKFSDIDNKVAFITASKTRSGIRQVPLSTKAMQLIERLKKDKNETDLIFRLKQSQLDSNFRKMKKMADLSGFTFHDARATAITRLAKKLDILDLARMVGHKNLSMLMVYYRESAAQLVDKLD